MRKAEAMGDDSVGEVGEQIALLLTAGLCDGQDARDELIAGGAVRPEAALAPQDRWPQGALVGSAGTAMAMVRRRATTANATAVN